MELDKEKDDLKKQNETLKQQLQEYKSLEEDLMANRIFEKAKKQFSVYLSLGGVILVLSGVLGFKALTDYFKSLAKEKIDQLVTDDMKKNLQAEGERQMTLLVQQSIQRITVATQPIGQPQEPGVRVAMRS